MTRGSPKRGFRVIFGGRDIAFVREERSGAYLLRITNPIIHRMGWKAGDPISMRANGGVLELRRCSIQEEAV